MLLQLEILSFFASFMYITYYVCDVFLTVYIKAQDKKKLKVQKQSERVAAISEKKKAQENDQVEIKSKHAPVNSETGEKLREILKRVQVNISRWYLDSARSLIIEWLALNKHDKDLNLLLADVYEREKKYQSLMKTLMMTTYSKGSEMYIPSEESLRNHMNVIKKL